MRLAVRLKAQEGIKELLGQGRVASTRRRLVCFGRKRSQESADARSARQCEQFDDREKTRRAAIMQVGRLTVDGRNYGHCRLVGLIEFLPATSVPTQMASWPQQFLERRSDYRTLILC